MPDVDESRVFAALSRYKAQLSVEGPVGLIEVEFRPVDNRVGDSPDYFLWVEIRFTLFGQPVKVAVPVPVEAEKGGIYGGALDDLRKLLGRQKHFAEIPMLVVAESGYAAEERTGELKTQFAISQVPIRQLD
jgi:hypothetical protein